MSAALSDINAAEKLAMFPPNHNSRISAMNKFLLAAAVALALGVTLNSNEAEARGFGGLHLQSGNVHVDLGNPHGFHHVGYNGNHGNFNHGWGGWGGGCGSTWQNTGHYDYHAPQLRWHGNHFDYQPGHYDYHNTGHWDHH